MSSSSGVFKPAARLGSRLTHRMLSVVSPPPDALSEALRLKKAQGLRIISVTPAGRRRYLEILLPYLLDNRGLIDEHHFWVNTDDPDDLAYLQEVQRAHPDFIRLIAIDQPYHPKQYVQRIRHFWPHAMEPKTLYIRFDDDICWIHREAVARLVTFRIRNPEYFFVYPAIINNGRTAYIHFVMGFVPRDFTDKWTLRCGDDMRLIHHPPQAGEVLHDHFLQYLTSGRVEEMGFEKYKIINYERVAINCVSWFGEDIAAFGGMVGSAQTSWEEEWWLTEVKAKELGRPSCIHGKALMAHFAFHTQREYMENRTNLLPIYRLLSRYRKSDTYEFLP